MPGCSASASRPIAWDWPTSTTPSSRSPSPASIRCRTSWRRSTAISSDCLASASCWPTIPAPGKTIMAGLPLKELKARGLVQRMLIVAPANLTFQWQREMTDKFRERFHVIRGGVLRANYGQNPWQEHDQVITSVSWVSLVEDARESLLPLALGPDHRRRGPQDERPQRGPQDLRLPPGREPVEDDRPLPADDGHAAQGRSRAFPPLPGPARPRRLRQHPEPPGGDAAAGSPLLPAADQGSPGHVPGPRDGRGPQALHEARSPHGRLRSGTATNSISTTS